MSDPIDRIDPPDPDKLASAAVPALYANRSYGVRFAGGGFRLASGEQIDSGPTYWRQAVLMPDALAVQVRDLLNELYPPKSAQN